MSAFLYKTLSLKLNKKSACTRTLFIKAHVLGGADEPADGHGLFVAGIPQHLESQHVKDVFEVFGAVTKVVVHPKGTSGLVIFEREEALAAVLSAAHKGHVVDYDKPQAHGPTGLKAAMEAHKAKYPGNSALQAELNDWMKRFEEEELRKGAAEAAGDDGWTLVTNKAGRKRAKGNTVSGGVSQVVAQDHLVRKKARVQDDFYKSQAREKQQSEYLELRKSFADAQAQVAGMRRTKF